MNEEFTGSNSQSSVTDLTEVEKNIANAGPAILTDRFIAAVGPWGVRIAFAELGINNDRPAFRSAVVMTIDNAIALSEMLQDLIKKNAAKQNV